MESIVTTLDLSQMPILPEDIHCLIEFINKLYKMKNQWVRRFIVVECARLNLMIGHVQTTQRNEAINRVIAEDTSPSSRLVDAYHGIYSRQQLRHAEMKSKLVTEFKSVLLLPQNMDHLFLDILKSATGYVALKILNEIKMINELGYCYEPVLEGTSTDLHIPRSVVPAFTVFSSNQCVTSANTSQAPNLEYSSRYIRDHIRKKYRQISSYDDEHGYLSLHCSCMNITTRGYPCRHILLIYSLESRCRSKAQRYAPLISYLNPYWKRDNLLGSYDITSAIVPVNVYVNRRPEQETFEGVHPVDLIEATHEHQQKVHELKV